MTDPRQRHAFEPAQKLLEPTPYDPATRRPVTTITGATLLVLRAVVVLLAGLEVFGSWSQTFDDPGTVVTLLTALIGSFAADGLTFATVVTAFIVISIVQLLFAVLIFLGRNAPRVIIMAVSVIDIVVSFSVWLGRGGSFESVGPLVSVAIDILILLALSSRSAAAYARRNEHPPAGEQDA